jgi:hypothetical protein
MEFICHEDVSDRADGLDVATPAGISAQLTQAIYLYRRYEFSPAHLDLFRATVARIRARHVDLILFVPPMSAYELELIRQSGRWSDLEKFKRALATVAPFEDYAAYNPMATKDEFYLHVIHFKAMSGHQILRTLLGMDAAPCDADTRIVAESGVRIDAANVDRVLADEDRARDQEVGQGSIYVRLAADAVRHAKISPSESSADEAAAE